MTKRRSFLLPAVLAVAMLTALVGAPASTAAAVSAEAARAGAGAVRAPKPAQLAPRKVPVASTGNAPAPRAIRDLNAPPKLPKLPRASKKKAAAVSVAAAAAAAQPYAAPETPQRMVPGLTYDVQVTVTNTTAAPLAARDWALGYHWYRPDGTQAITLAECLKTALPADLAPGASVTLAATVKAPLIADLQNIREQFLLAWDLVKLPLGPWLSDSAGVPPLAQPITVQRPTSNQLGLESFYQYSSTPTGAGTGVLVNEYAGNAVFSMDPLSNPSRGLASFLRLTYNSRDEGSSFAGTGWSVAAASITRLGSPLQFEGPNLLLGYPDKVNYIDGDGTGHFFELNKHGTLDLSKWTYDSPAGVHLYFQKVPGTDQNRQWVMTRPEGTQFFFDAKGYHTVTRDPDGNELRLTYETTLIGNLNTGVLKQVSDSAGRRTLSLDYYRLGDSYTYWSGTQRKSGSLLLNPAIVGKLKSVTDISGRTVSFVYSDFGALREVVDGAGTPVAKTYLFQYENEPITVKLTRITDPRGKVTTLDYFENITHHDLPLWGRVDTVTDRSGAMTYYDYGDPDGLKGEKVSATVTDANQHTSSSELDSYGRPEKLTNALGDSTVMVWDADNNVVRLREQSGAVTTWVYDQLTGYPTKVTDPEAAAKGLGSTVLEYATSLDGHVADLVRKTSPEGRTWQFGYDTRHNVVATTDPIGTSTAAAGDYTTRYAYDAFGQVSSMTDANGNVTKYTEYDPTGFPRRITDPYNNSSVIGYSATGDVLTSQDATGATSTFTYDTFRRELVTKTPKDAAAGTFITTPAPTYDANDNVTVLTAANGAITRSTFDAMDRSTATTAPAHAGDTGPRTSTVSYDPVGNVLAQTSARGTATSTAGDFTTSFRYDAIDRVTDVTDPLNHTASARYDNAGNLVTIIDARKNATADPADVTTRMRYDLNHRSVGTTDASGATTSTEYDADGNVVASTDEAGNRTVSILDKRSAPIEIRVPHTTGATPELFVTRYEYDQVGNRTRTITPRGVASTDDPNDFAEAVVYDAMNRVSERLQAFKTGDADAAGTDKIVYAYDPVGNLASVSAPPSQNETRRNDTSYEYYSNGWIKKTTDPYGISTSYDYNPLGQQTARSLISAAGTNSRTQDWTYFPDGALSTHSDSGVPVGQYTVTADNDDDSTVTGTWATQPRTAQTEGRDYRLHAAAATTTDSFAWRVAVPVSGRYQVLARYPDGSATNAKYTVQHDAGSTVATVDQTQRRGTFVSLGTFDFTGGSVKTVSLSGAGNGTVAADAVRFVRDNTAPPVRDTRTYTYGYDLDGNLTSLDDSTQGSAVDTFRMAYDDAGRASRVQEIEAGAVANTTSYSYDENGNITGWQHDDQSAAYTYDARDLLAKAENGVKLGGAATRTTTFRYDPRRLLTEQVKANGNTTTLGYFADSLLQRMTEKTSGGSTINDHTMTYTPNGDRATERVVKQDPTSLATRQTTDYTYTYDPRDRVRKVEKTGDGAGTENYKHDANDNVTSQTVLGTTTSFNYDRNRLKSASAVGGLASFYGYDSLGRLSTVTTGGAITEQYQYDGFDHTVQTRAGSGAGAKTTTSVYDPLDRVTSRTVDSGTTAAKRTDMTYLGLSAQTLTETQGGTARKSYQLSPSGELLSQIVRRDGGDFESSYYSYNTHQDVDALTGENGNNRSIYGYTAYGSSDPRLTKGKDDASATAGERVGSEPYNAFRFGTARVDPSSGDYDMGARSYAPDLNRFLSLDVYNGALSDMSLSTNPFTLNRYAFAAGNPLSMLDATGHWPSLSDIGHAALDVVGLVPVVGEAADLANAGWYAAEGDYVNAALSAASAIPFAGYGASAVKAGKYASKAYDAIKTTDRALTVAKDVTKAEKVVEGGAEVVQTTTKVATGTKTATTGAKKAIAPPKPKARPGAPATAAKAGGGAGPTTLYHYTTEAGQAGILDSQKLLPSLKSVNPKDAFYGNGQYVTDVVPGTRSNASLSMTFIRNRFQGKRFTHYVEIDVTGLTVKKGRGGVFVIPGEEPLDLLGRIVSSGVN